jgi:hypothetical protein
MTDRGVHLLPQTNQLRAMLPDDTMLARAIDTHWALGNHGAFLITAPTRAEDAIDRVHPRNRMRLPNGR